MTKSKERMIIIKESANSFTFLVASRSNILGKHSCLHVSSLGAIIMKEDGGELKLKVVNSLFSHNCRLKNMILNLL
jgi:hypothetical protein